MNRSLYFSTSVTFFGWLLLLGPGANAAVNVPNCADLLKFGQELNLQQMVSLNALPPGQGLPEPPSVPESFISPHFREMFGQAPVRWAPPAAGGGKCAPSRYKGRNRRFVSTLTRPAALKKNMTPSPFRPLC